MNLDLDCVASFLVLVDETSYRRAAGRLHLTTSALSRRIQRLERQVGAPLVDRGPAGCTGPTAAGRRFAATAPLLLAAGRAASAAVREPDRGPDARSWARRPVGSLPGTPSVLPSVARAVRTPIPGRVPWPTFPACRSRASGTATNTR